MGGFELATAAKKHAMSSEGVFCRSGHRDCSHRDRDCAFKGEKGGYVKVCLEGQQEPKPELNDLPNHPGVYAAKCHGSPITRRGR